MCQISYKISLFCMAMIVPRKKNHTLVTVDIEVLTITCLVRVWDQSNPWEKHFWNSWLFYFTVLRQTRHARKIPKQILKSRLKPKRPITDSLKIGATQLRHFQWFWKIHWRSCLTWWEKSRHGIVAISSKPIKNQWGWWKKNTCFLLVWLAYKHLSQ
jgi:hypothetical protein